MSNSTYLHEAVPWQQGPKERGGFAIIFSCLAVIVTSVWSVLHLNVPEHESKRPLQWIPFLSITTIRKVKWAFIMLIFPELVFAHAVVELRMALDDLVLSKEYEHELSERGWSIYAGKWPLFIRGILSGRWIWRETPRTLPTNGLEPTLPGSIPLKILPAIVSTVDKGSPNQSLVAIERNVDEISPCSASAQPGAMRGPAEAGPLSPNAVGTPTEPDQAKNEQQQKPSDQPSHRWTLTHVYLANMGGIRVNGEVATAPLLALSTNRYHTTVAHRGRAKKLQALMTSFKISEAEIEDKSKADNLVKLLWIWQLFRLWVDLAARATTRLSITQLEIITLSFSVISLFTYIVQWRKPKDVEVPLSFSYPHKIMWHDITSIMGGTDYVFSTLSSIYLTKFIAKPVSPDIHRVRNDVYRPGLETLFFTLLSVSTILFGLIHLGAWSFDFPTQAEGIIWRACALTGVVLPVLSAFVAFILRRTEGQLERRRRETSKTIESKNLRYKVFFNSIYGHTWEHIQRELKRGDVEDSVVEEYGSHVKGMNELDRRIRLVRFLKRWHLIPTTTLYLSTRLIIIIIACMSFRSAPRGIYMDTWVNFLPNFR